MPLFYMRGDIIYAKQGFANITTGEFTSAPNNALDSFEYGISQDEIDGKCRIAGQYLLVYSEIYNGPVDINLFDLIVGGNISIYEYLYSKTKAAIRAHDYQ